MKLITQEAPMGCAIACIASLSGLSYKQMRGYFSRGEIKEQTSGFYNRDIINALIKIGISAKAFSIKRWGNRKIKAGTIVFVERSKKYPAGHYLLKTKNGWMNPWINYPNINPAKAGFQKTLPGRLKWVIKTMD
jgi:ABC-type bacteriocin/lantibiotic exporter with double-glycine peptidase domain